MKTPEFDLSVIQHNALRDSEFWFPALHDTDHDAIMHFALGLAGETGELCNLIKKINRSTDRDAAYSGYQEAIRFEMADVLIYLCDMAQKLGISLAAAVQDKRAVLVERWGEPPVLTGAP